MGGGDLPFSQTYYLKSGSEDIGGPPLRSGHWEGMAPLHEPDRGAAPSSTTIAVHPGGNDSPPQRSLPKISYRHRGASPSFRSLGGDGAPPRARPGGHPFVHDHSCAPEGKCFPPAAQSHINLQDPYVRGASPYFTA